MTARASGERAWRARAAAPRRAAFGARDPDHFEPAEIDETALRRAAFAAEERARSRRPAEAEVAPPLAEPDRADRPLAQHRLAALVLPGPGRRPPFLSAPPAHRRAAGVALPRQLGRRARRILCGLRRRRPACLWWIADGFRLHRTAAPMSFGRGDERRRPSGARARRAERRGDSPRRARARLPRRGARAPGRAAELSEAGTSRCRRATPVYVREKSMGTAYLLWFVLGGFSAHRFYLGYPTSA